MKRTLCLVSAELLFASVILISPAKAQIAVDSFDGPVTQHEIDTFRSYVKSLTPGADGNLAPSNEWVQGHSGENTKAMGLMYEITGDVGILDQMIRFCDTVLSERNDLAASPVGQHKVWTGRIDPVWPNVTTAPIGTGGEQGDPPGHLANCARLILQTPSIWNTPVGIGDPHGYGATYLARAKKYVAEAEYSMDHHILSDELDLSHQNHYYFAAGDPYKGGTPVPWNQVMMFSYAIENLAIAHSILADDPARAARYDALVQANIDWFFSSGVTSYTDSKGHTAYSWGYALPKTSGEDNDHGSLDCAGFYRAYMTGRYNITAAQLTPFANMFCDVMTLSQGNYAGRTDGTTGTGNAAGTNYVRSGYLFLTEFRPDQYHAMMSADLTAGGTTTNTDRFSRFEWIKNKRYLASAGFSLGATPSSQTVTAGGGINYTVTVTPSGGFNGTVNLSSSVLPAGVTGNFSPASITNGSGTSTFSVSTTTSTIAGNYTLMITGKSGTISHSANVALVVNSLPQASAPTFTPGSGTYTSAQNVSISSATSGASFRYTTDGSTPSETAGIIYSSPVSISVATTLKAIAYKAGFADSTVTTATYAFGPPPTFNFEAESLSPTGAGATVSISNDANASGGVVEFLNSTAAGQIMTFTTPSLPAGTYKVQLRYKTNTTRGQHTVKIDGTQVGVTIDQYSTTVGYTTVTLGTVTFNSASAHTVAMTVTGKRSASTQFYITADKFTFVGQ